jgi:8-oxo-dGTP pyrophosphatase MutT (NUDIX family)
VSEHQAGIDRHVERPAGAVGEQDVAGLRIRQAVRAILLTADREVLLVRFEFPTREVWALPGGGIDLGETPEAALRRELVEELGHEPLSIGPHVWNRLHVIPFLNGQWDGQRDRIHLVDAPERFEPRPALTWEQLRAEHVHELRWWTIDEIAAAEDLHFVPGDLAARLRDLVAHGPPRAPVDIGV